MLVFEGRKGKRTAKQIEQAGSQTPRQHNIPRFDIVSWDGDMNLSISRNGSVHTERKGDGKGTHRGNRRKRNCEENSGGHKEGKEILK